MSSSLERSDIEALLADLDTVFEPSAVGRDAARVVAQEHGLAQDWLNEAVKGFLPGPDPDTRLYYSGAALNVDVASARHLLALKLFASPVESDAADGMA